MSHHPDHPDDRPDVGYETTDANPKVLAYSFVGLAALIFLAFVAMWLLFVYLDYSSGSPVTQNQRRVVEYRPPSPRLQTSPGTELKKVLEKEQQQMESYGWVNKASGIVRIPVGRAMDIVSEKGLPNLPPIGASEDTPNPFSTPGMETTPLATGTDSSRPAAPLGGPAGRAPSSPGGTQTEPQQQSQPDGRNRNP